MIPPSTHAQASRERRDAVSGEVMPETRLIRFVAGPQGEVTPDLARKLPRRGVWIEATREAVDQAVRRNAFARSAKAPLKPRSDLADQVGALLRQRLLHGLGLARRAGELTLGFEKAAATIETGRAAWLIEASDGAADGRRKMLQTVHRAAAPPRLLGAFSADELSLALGLAPVIHLAFIAGGSARRWTADVDRYAGFGPLLPQSWRPEIGSQIGSGEPGQGRSEELPPL